MIGLAFIFYIFWIADGQKVSREMQSFSYFNFKKLCENKICRLSEWMLWKNLGHAPIWAQVWTEGRQTNDIGSSHDNVTCDS